MSKNAHPRAPRTRAIPPSTAGAGSGPDYEVRLTSDNSVIEESRVAADLQVLKKPET
jgi:hypothetical protein